MVENKTEKGLIGIMMLMLIALGVNVMPDDTHYSDSLNMTAHCERLSSTGLTCYPNTDTTKGKMYSETGWQPIIQDSIPIQDTTNKKYKCDTEKCVTIE